MIIDDKLNPQDKPRFKRIYIYCEAINKVFLDGCRTISGFDGSFLKSNYKGQILRVVGVDGSNDMYPVAYDVVDSEC